MEREGLSRREFLKIGGRERQRIRPPGIVEKALVACTGCGKCQDHCPAGIIALIDGLPALDFSAGACTFCDACAAACPEPVFTAGDHRFEHIITIAGSCLPFHRVDCQACRDACPTEAILFRPVRGGPFVPELSEDACTGCGACISVCPVGAVTVATRSREILHA